MATATLIPAAVRRNQWMNQAARLARYKHPEHLVVLDELPRNTSGKVVKGLLREQDPA
jgi:acyl-CoA synthetase (AMP-forming)/AMP-acid ligase II